VGLILLGLGGVVTFALETTYIHLLAVVAGNSAYAFSLMVFAFLVGLSSGAGLGRRWLATSRGVLERLAVLELLLAVTLLLGSFLWAAVPSYFASFAQHAPTRTFAAREFIRFLVCCLAMVPPAVLIGAIYPLAMECVGASHPTQRVAAMGRAAALNTLGNIAGALLGGFVLVNELGSLRGIQLLAATCIVLAAVPLLASRAWRAPIPLAAAALALELLVVQPSSLDLNALSTGANVYFQAQGWGTVVDHRESVEGGLTTLAESTDADGTPVRTLLTNGKFQGDDSLHREMKAQIGFSLVPLLHVPERGRAAIIGLGTGVSTRIASDAGFEHLDVIELSQDIVDMARTHFSRINGGVLERPRVHTHVTDGRNFLLLSNQPYEFIGMEVSSIWFAGAANLYNREFYTIARGALAERGVLQQWIQLHRLSHEDILSIIATLRTVFPRVWLYVVGSQGVLVGCTWDCSPKPETLASIDQEPGLAQARSVLQAGSAELLGSRLLAPEDVDRMLASAGVSGEALVSTDDNLRLEYSTPRGNVRRYAESLRDNLEFLRGFMPREPGAQQAPPVATDTPP
jgi:spermidine synthase